MFLFEVFAGTADVDDVKLALALKCQRARNFAYDTEGRWEQLMEQMAACTFEGDSGTEQLCDALRDRLREKPNEPRGLVPLNILAASAFKELEFVERGL